MKLDFNPPPQIVKTSTFCLVLGLALSFWDDWCNISVIKLFEKECALFICWYHYDAFLYNVMYSSSWDNKVLKKWDRSRRNLKACNQFFFIVYVLLQCHWNTMPYASHWHFSSGSIYIIWSENDFIVSILLDIFKVIH